MLVLLTLPGFAQVPQTVTGKRIKLELDSLITGWKLVLDSPVSQLKYSKSVLNEWKRTNELFNQNGSPLGFQLSIDQDAFYKKNMDKDYTMGLMATIFGHVNRNRDIFFKQNVDEIEANRFRASFGFSGFTPLHLEYDFIDKTDRPYAAIVFLSYEETYAFNSHQKGNFSRAKSFKHGLLLGDMGKGTARVAQFIQTAIHSGQRALADDPSDVRPNPLGWKFAVGHNNSLPLVLNYNADFSLVYEYKFFTPSHFFQPFKFTVKPTAGINIGTLYDNLSIGLDYQLGFLAHDEQFGNTVFKDLSGKRKGVRVGLSLIGDLFAQGWLHNSLLNGILFKDNSDTYVISHGDMEKLTSYNSIGGMLSVGKVKVGYSVYRRSKVIKIDSRNQYFGRAFLKIDI